jgi:adenylate cyclase
MLIFNIAISPLGVITGCTLVAVLARWWRLRAVRRRRMARGRASTFLFADLVGFTALAERCGDEVAARVAGEFRALMAGLSRRHGAWHVKSMGDGAMIWAPDATRALALAAHALIAVGARGDLLPVRVGAHTGAAVMRGDDWYGSAVNLASRLANQAGANEALVSGATRCAAGTDHRWPLAYQGEVALRGVGQPVGVWRLSVEPQAADERPTYPVATSSRQARVAGGTAIQVADGQLIAHDQPAEATRLVG